MVFFLINWIRVLVEVACQKTEIPIDLHGNAKSQNLLQGLPLSDFTGVPAG